MKINGNRALLYVFRMERLRRELEREKTRAILKMQGYRYKTAQEAIGILKSRMGDKGSFPHEVGLFLGYPEEDVRGFMINKEKTVNAADAGRYIVTNVRPGKPSADIKNVKRSIKDCFWQESR